MKITELDSFTLAYITAALWSTNDESTPQGDKPLDANYGVEDIAPETLDKIIADCAKFQKENATDLFLYYDTLVGDSIEVAEQVEYAGHDFWLSRNGHGSGFFDADWQGVDKEVCDRLQAASEVFGSFDLYVGDDGKIYA